MHVSVYIIRTALHLAVVLSFPFNLLLSKHYISFDFFYIFGNVLVSPHSPASRQQAAAPSHTPTPCPHTSARTLSCPTQAGLLSASPGAAED
ncbi:hypothetical protein E2C01_025391 [Portunus trituberculatus]|uniref:Uncharacterized protein n=1 Tax=Portunus trituberculatus TaxID=210409 RepID=A0A5B7EFH4_PORTR|nr:hypothetical protein [Portunus trituberculatus]